MQTRWGDSGSPHPCKQHETPSVRREEVVATEPQAQAMLSCVTLQEG